MASVLSLSAVGQLHATSFPLFHDNGKAAPAAAKMVSFTVRNDAKASLVLKSGDQEFTIEPGKTAKMKLPEGTELINVSGTDKQAAGSLLTRVDRQLQGNVLAVS